MTFELRIVNTKAIDFWNKKRRKSKRKRGTILRRGIQEENYRKEEDENDLS